MWAVRYGREDNMVIDVFRPEQEELANLYAKKLREQGYTAYVQWAMNMSDLSPQDLG